MALSPQVKWSLILGGLGLAAAGVVVYRKNGGTLGQSRVVHKLPKAAPVMGKTNSSGMSVSHQRSNDMSIEQRVRSIHDLVWKSIQQPEMRKLALQITRGCPERDKKCEAKAVYNYVKRHVRYTGDVAPVKMGADGPLEAIDLYQRADRTLEFGGGDCDDHSILNATLLSLNGITARLKVTAEKGAGKEYGHIYTTAGVGSSWLALDTTLPGSNNFGKEVPYGASVEFPV